MTKHKLENSAIFTLEPKRALEVLEIIEMLAFIGKANYKEASKNGINKIEWNKAQHFFLTTSSKNLPIVRQMLASKEQTKLAF